MVSGFVSRSESTNSPVHDTDLALWCFGEDSVVKSVSASGDTAVTPELQEYGDCDNEVGIVEF